MNATNKRPPEAFYTTELFEKGLGHVVVSRFKGSDRVESGVFLLDVYCLGVKDAFFTQLTLGEYQDRLLKRIFREMPTQSIEPACARKLIEGAVAYAQNLGLAPHPDYKKACRVLGGIQSKDCATEFTYGKDGKPLFISGPYDSEEKCQRILKLLSLRCGQNNFHFLVGGPLSQMQDLADELDEDIEEPDSEKPN
jgi:hypothetical protein